MQNTLRAFVALTLGDDCIDILAGLQDGMRSHGLKMSWVRPRNLHLTMKFLGDIQESASSEVAAVMQQTAARHAPVNLILQGLGVFPGIKRPRVLWAGLGGDTPGLADLAADLDDGLARIGFDRDRRAFKAHVTLARIRKRVSPQRLLQALEEVGRYAPHDFEAHRLVLMKSDLQPGGAVYRPQAEALLA